MDTGSSKLNSIMANLEDVRVEIIGSKKYAGVASNLKAKFDEKCAASAVFEEKEDLLDIALETWIRNILLKEEQTNDAKRSIKPWEKELKKNIRKKKII